MEYIIKLLKSRTVQIALVQAVTGIIVAILAYDPVLATSGFGLILKSLLDILTRIRTVEPISAK